MGQKRRDRLTIMAQILDVARGELVKTHIMRRASLSSHQTNNYLASLQEADLIKFSIKEGKKVYTTTSKGVKYLESFIRLKACMHFASDNLAFWFSKRKHTIVVERFEKVGR